MAIWPWSGRAFERSDRGFRPGHASAVLASTKRVRAPSTAVQYGAAALLVAVGLSVRLWLYPSMEFRSPLLVFVLPTLLVAMFGRFGPPAFATSLSTLGTVYFLVEPGGSLYVSDPDDRIRIILFAAQNLLLGSLVAGLQRARLRTSIAADALAESVHLLEDVVGSTPHAIVAADRNGTIRAWNSAAERMFGWTAAEVLGRPAAHIPAAAAAAAADLWARAASGEVVPPHRTTRLRKGGTELLCEISVGPLRDAKGNYVGVVGTLTDVTQQHTLEEQLRQSQKMEAIGELAAGVAHDFNNHLTAIIGYAQLASDTLPPHHPAHDDLREICRAAETSATLTRQLLAFSRRQVLQLQPLDVTEIIRNCEQMLRRTVREDIIILTHYDPAPVWIVADAAQLEHVLLNLVVNARDAMPAGGRVKIETSRVDVSEENAAHHFSLVPGPYVIVAVTDTGTGMSKEIQGRIFEPFFTTKGLGRGTGLGLAMVQGTVRQMGGSIWVTSEPGRGTTFRMYFPRVAAAAADTAAVPSARPEGGAERLLIVDDDDGVRRLAARTLSGEGYRVDQASTVDEAILAVRSSPPDLLITDVVMPAMHGPELARILRDLGVTRVLYMSGYTDRPAFGAQIESGEVHFLSKPFTPQDLTAKVRAVLDERDAHP